MLRSESYKKGLFLSTGFNILARGVGFVNTLILAYYFGANASTDIYFLVLSVAMIITGIINGVDYYILIPEAMKLRERESEDASRRFLNFFICLYACIGLLIASLVIASPVLFYSVFSKFDSSVLHQNKNILYVGSIIIVFQLLNNLLSAILTSYKFFTISIFTSLINTSLAMTITICFHRQLGIVGTISGIALGYFINFLLLLFILKRFQKWSFFDIAWMKNKIVWKNIGLMQVNIVPLWLRNSIGLYLLSGFDKGIITALNLGLQIVAIPEILIINQLLAVAGIKFNELHAKNNNDEANNTFLMLAKMGIAFTTILGCSFFLLSDKIIAIVFSKSSLNAVTLNNIALVFSFMIFCLPAKFLVGLSTNIFTAFQKVNATIVFSFVIHCIVTVIFIFLVKYFGLKGYLVGMNLHFYLFFFLALIPFKRVLGFVKYQKTIIYFLKDLLLNAIVCLLSYWIYHFLFGVIQNNIAQVMCGFIIYFLLLIIINELFNINKVLKIKQYKDYVFQKFFS